MGINLSNISHCFTSAPGIWVFYLIPGLALAVLAGMALTRHGRHLLIGSGILFLLQALGLIFSLLSQEFGRIALPTFLILEQAIAALTLLWVVWTCLEEQQKALVTWASILLTAGLLLFLAISLLIIQLQPAYPSLAQIPLHSLWQSASLLLVLTGLILILVRRPAQWSFAVLILAGLGVGHGLQLFVIDSSTSLAMVRLSQAISLPWLLVLVQRLPAKAKASPTPIKAPLAEDPNQPVDTKPELVDLLLQINLQESAADKFKATVRAISLSLVADICYLVRISPNRDRVELVAGYDLIREITLPAATLQREELLHISDAWEDQRVLRLSQADADARDAVTLTLLLKYHRIGNLLAYPLHLPGEPATGGVIILSPYTNRHFGASALRLLDEVQDTLAQVLYGENPLDTIKSELEQKAELVAILRQTSESLSKILDEKEALIASLKAELQRFKAKYQIEKLESVKQIDALRQEIQSFQLQTTPQQDLSRELEQLSQQIRQLTGERDQLRTALARAEARMKHLENQAGQTGPTRLSMDNQIISLDSIAANVRLQVATKLQAKGLELELINPDGRQMIKTDPELLQTILQGLLENAIAASPPETALQLHLSISLETGMLIAEATDRGEGLTQQEQTLLFSATESTIPGIGSLQAIRNAIRAIRVLNGKIWLRSIKHQFTTFRVQLPVRIID